MPRTPRNDAQGDLRQAELGPVAGDAQVAGQGQLTAAAQGVAVHRGNGHLPHGLQQLRRLVTQGRQPPPGLGRLLHHLGDVRPGGKGLVSRPDEQDHAHVVPVPHVLQGGDDLPVDLAVEGIAARRPVDGHHRNGAFYCQSDVFHRGCLLIIMLSR